MNKVTFPIKAGDQGQPVVDLQEALLVLLDQRIVSPDPAQANSLTEGVKAERAHFMFSDATRKAVAVFQGNHGLPATTVVDAATADKINGFLQQLGALPPDAPPTDGLLQAIQAQTDTIKAQTDTLKSIDQGASHLAAIEEKLGALGEARNPRRLVSGRVTRSDGQPGVGVIVAAFSMVGDTPTPLNQAKTDGEGLYAIVYELPPDRDAINLRVAAYAEDGTTVAAAQFVESPGPAVAINIALPAVDKDAASRLVSGRILFEHGLPAENVTLRLYRRGFGGAEGAAMLAETTTQAHGLYSLPYDSQDAANLEIRAVSGETEVPLTKIVRSAGEKEVLNLVAPSAVQRPDAEFARLAADLAPHVGEALAGLAAAQENADQPDLSLLHEASGWDARILATAATAVNLSAAEETGLPADALYAVLRAGLPADKLQLARVSPAALDQALANAQAANIVNLPQESIDGFKDAFDKFSLNTRLAIQTPGSSATYGDMLGKLELNEDQQKTFARIYLDHRGDADSLWDKVTAAGLGDAVPALKLQGKLAFLTTNNPTLTAKLQAGLPQADPRDLVTQGLYKSAAWLDLIDEVPPAFGNKPSYAEDMARRVRISYSTDVTWHMITTGELTLEGQGFPDTVGTFLKNAIALGFKLGEMPVEQFAKANPGVFDNIPPTQVEPTKEMIKSLQRVYQITPGMDAMKALLNEGVLSAQDVLAYPLDVFLERFGDKFPSLDEARLVYRKAEQVSNVTMSLFNLARELESAPQLFATGGTAEVRKSVRDEMIKRFPTLEGLFGSLDFCDCEHCRSVLSPAAYLVDLLQFLDPEPAVWQNFLRDWKTKHGGAPYPFKTAQAFQDAGNPAGTERTPYEILNERRPDISNIPLTCENTQTALPHIDLVNEILEYYVANDALKAEAARDTGDATTAELLAEPQNIEPKAYATVAAAKYPLSLPFDLWLETARQFCNYFETPFARLLETFRTTDELGGRYAVFIESLGLSPAEAALFTDADPLARWFELYGYADEDGALKEATDADSGQRIDLNSAKALSRRLGVTYQELVDVLATGFVNPGLDGLELLHKLGLSIDDATFFRDHKALYDTNRDLVGKQRAELGDADQARWDALKQGDWDDLNEAAAFVKIVQDAGKQFPGFDGDAWLQNDLPNLALDKILVLSDRNASCNFDETTLQYAAAAPGEGEPDRRKVDGEALLRINLFVRLWRKLGWPIDDVDRALRAFVPANTPFTKVFYDKQPLRTALITLAHLKALDEQVKVGKLSRQKLLSLWTDIPTVGKQSLYAALFLSRSVLKSGQVPIMVAGERRFISIFDDPLGGYLRPASLKNLQGLATYAASGEDVTDADKLEPAAFAGEPRVAVQYDPLSQVQTLEYQGVLMDGDRDALIALSASPALPGLLAEVQARAADFMLIKGHMLPLQGALGLTAEEIGAVLDHEGQKLDTAPLSLANVSLLYRYAVLAKALKLSVADMIALMGLSGLKPFAALSVDPLAKLADDVPFSQTLAFVDVARKVKDSGLRVADLQYLLRHQYDPAGKTAPGAAAMLDLTRTLAAGIAAIRKEHAIPGDPATLTDDVLTQKLGLVLPPDVVTRFLAMLNGTAEFTATAKPTDAQRLDPATFAGNEIVRRVTYSTTSKVQALTVRGALTEKTAADLAANANLQLTAAQRTFFGDLLQSVRAQAQGFFDKYLLKQQVNDAVDHGFLEATDYRLLFAPPKEQEEQDPHVRLRLQRGRLANAFLPFLQRQLIRQFVIQTLAAATGGGAALVEALLTEPALLEDPSQAGQPLLAALTGSAMRGVTVHFFDTPEPPAAPAPAAQVVFADADTDLRDATGKLLRPDATGSARFEGYLEVPAAGPYRFFALLDKAGAEAELCFDHLPAPLFNAAATDGGGGKPPVGPEEYVELKAGVPYRFTLEFRNLGGGGARLQVQGETLPRDGLAQLPLYPDSAVARSSRAQVLLAKSLQLIQALGLSERELRYLLANAADFGGVALSKLPTRAEDDSDGAAAALFGQFLRLAGYAALKRDLAGGSDDLIAVFEAAQAALPDDGTKGAPAKEAALNEACRLLGLAARRGQLTVKTAANALLKTPALVNEQAVGRVWEALQLVEKLGVPVRAVVDWAKIANPTATAGQRAAAAHDLKETIKARFDPETWQRVAQPIFDRLRQRQSDALVAYVMQRHGFDRPEQLFEFFLIDPLVEPVVQTSRIRAAIGAVQVFIQRGLLNMEPKVAASAINSRHWQWMKQYRVWEANRKIFLFPENWLEPEFRDDKTHLFKELEGKLLQGDVSNDLVEDAFFSYLTRLDELARLDIVGMYCEENALDPASNTLHVIGRTHLEPFKYFYRRYAHDVWTPWEPVPVDIQGDHIVPVVWRDRLNLFWVTFIVQANPQTLPADHPAQPQRKGEFAVLDRARITEPPAKLVDMTLSDTASMMQSTVAKRNITVLLHWSQYFQGEWSTSESGGMSGALNASVDADFNDKRVFIHVTKELTDDGEEGAVLIHLGGPIGQAFRVVSRNGAPEAAGLLPRPALPYATQTVLANRYAGKGSLKVSYDQQIVTENGKRTKTVPFAGSIVQGAGGFTLLAPSNALTIGGPDVAPLVAPVFYHDTAAGNTFYIEPAFHEKTIEEWHEYVTRTPEPEVEWDHPDWWKDLPLGPSFPKYKLPKIIDQQDPLWRNPIDPRARFGLADQVDWMTHPATVVQFGGELVAGTGRAGLAIMEGAAGAAAEATAAAASVAVNAGSAVAKNAALVVAEPDAFQLAGLGQAGGALNVVGGSGLNAALRKNLNGFAAGKMSGGLING